MNVWVVMFCIWVKYSDRCVLICILSTSTFWPFGEIWNWIEQIQVLMSINDPCRKLCNFHLLNRVSLRFALIANGQLNGDAQRQDCHCLSTSLPGNSPKYQLSSNLTDEQMLNSKRLRVVELWGRRNRRLLVMINVASWSLLSASLSESKLNGSRSLNVIFVTVLFILKAPISRPDDYIKTLDHPWNCAYALIRYIMFR